MSQLTSERQRTATFGPVAISIATHGKYQLEVQGNNFGQRWRAARLYFPLDGELRFRPFDGEQRLAKMTVCAARSAVLAAGWHPFHLECDGAQVLEVDIATERFEERDLLTKFKFATWAPETCLPAATAAALRELMDHPGSTPPIRAETTRVVEALIGSLLQVAQTNTELLPVGASNASQPVASSNISPRPDGEKVDYPTVVKYIGRKFANPNLTPATIATHFGVSLRTLYRCFDDGGDGISHAIAEARLAAALEKLADPRLSDYPLDEIAERCGYRSPLALRRATMAATGHTPSQLRAKPA